MVSDRFNTKTLSTFSKGPDSGQDAAGCCVQFKDEDGNILTNQNLVVQVKHTKNELNTITKNVYKNEGKKVKELVQKGLLDIYVLFTNYKIPGGLSRLWNILTMLEQKTWFLLERKRCLNG